MIYALRLLLAGIVVVVMLLTVEWSSATTFSDAALPKQVFPPRPPQPSAPPNVPPGRQRQLTPPSPPSMPGRSPQRRLTTQIPFARILGDPTQSHIEISNTRSPHDSNFVLGRGIAGRISQDKDIVNAGNGNTLILLVHGLSNPPAVSGEGQELRLRFIIPSLQFKTYYGSISPEGDVEVRDMVAEDVVIDVFLTPTITQQMLPTIQSARVVFTGTVKDSGKCTFFFDIVFPVNVCSVASDYLKEIKPNVENGLRDGLMHPRTRAKFDQLVSQFLRAELLAQAGINPASPSQVSILRAGFRGTDYVVEFLPQLD